MLKEKSRIQEGFTLIDRTVTLGCREVMAGVEHVLIGMAVLVAETWLRAVIEASTVRAQ